MKKILYITFVGLLGLLFACEKDGEQIFLPENPTAPTIVSMPDLTLERNNGTDILEFVGTPVDPGFSASVRYFLETSATGDNFNDVTQIASSNGSTTFTISESDLNALLLKKFPADQVSSLDFRIRSRLVVDAGTGAPGAANDAFEYNSETETANVTLYGLPRLDLLNSGIDQKIESPLGNGVYSGFVKLDPAKPFSLFEPDNATTYGGADGVLVEDGAAIVPPASGWHKLDADINALTYSLEQYSVGVVGEFTSWGEQADRIMEYDPAKGYWFITVDLPAGPMKFRLNSKWDVNWGPGEDTDLPAAGGVMELPNSSGNIVITAAGNYTIHLTLNGSSGSATFIKN